MWYEILIVIVLFVLALFLFALMCVFTIHGFPWQWRE